jgi:hypothetical protein
VKRLASSILLLALGAGCWDPKSNMTDQPRKDPYEATNFYADGKATRLPVPGTVAIDVDPSVDAPASDSIPFPIGRVELERGQKLFSIYCIHCHGQLGNGQGMVVQRGFITPPSYHIDRLKKAPDSHIYNVISHGYGGMYRFSDVIQPEDRWKVVAYVRALQAASDSPNLTAEEKAAFIARGDRETHVQPVGGNGP